MTEVPTGHIHRARQIGNRCICPKIGVEIFDRCSYPAVRWRKTALQRCEVNAPRECSAFSYCFHVPFRTIFARTVTTCAMGSFTTSDAFHSLKVTRPTFGIRKE